MKKNKKIKKKNIIHVDLEDKADLYDDFNWNILNDELAEYIDKESSKLSLNSKIFIEIHAVNMKDEDKNKMRNCIKKYYKEELEQLTQYNNMELRQKVYLFIVGMMFLFISRYIPIDYSIISEILTIAGWVAMWDVIYTLLFQNTETKYKFKRTKQLTRVEITFK